MPKIEKDYYVNENVVWLARDLIGKVLVTKIKGKLTAGIITETEAYDGINDKACHAFGGRRTNRTEVMFAEGGKAYVYLCYGLHHLFNIVVSVKDDPRAVLVRAIWPVEGVEEILKRRKAKQLSKDLCTGPGKVAMALGLTVKHTGQELTKDAVWVEDRGIKVPRSAIAAGPRIGVDYAGEDAKLPYRFFLKEPIMKFL